MSDSHEVPTRGSSVPAGSHGVGAPRSQRILSAPRPAVPARAGSALRGHRRAPNKARRAPRFTLHAASVLVVGLLVSTAAWAQVQVTQAWARATVPGQQGTGAFMTLRAAEPLRLVGVSSPVAGVAEVHEMRMDGDVMRMRAIEALELPANTAVELRPGGHHIMLMDLKRTLKAGEKIPLELRLQTADGQPRVQRLDVEVRK